MPIFKEIKFSRIAILILLLSWVLINFLSRALEAEDFWLTNFSQTTKLLSIMVSLTGSFFEIYFLWSLSKIISRYLPKQFSFLGFLLFFTFFILIFTSIALFINSRVFLDRNQISAFTTFTAGVIAHTSTPDLLKASGLVILALFPALVYWSAANSITLKFSLKGAIISFLGLSFFSYLLPQMLFSNSEFKIYSYFISNRCTPGTTLFWHRIFYDHSKDFKVVDLETEAAEDLDQYAKEAVLPGKPKNLILISIEALRYDYLAEAGEMPQVIPNLNKLASTGVSFSQGRSVSNESSYSKVAVLTGIHPLKNYYRDTYANIDYPNVPLYDLLSKAGYETAYFSSTSDTWQNVSKALEVGELDYKYESENNTAEELRAFFDESFDGDFENNAVRDYVATEKLNSWMASNKNKPFFAFLFFESTHFPFTLPNWANKKLFKPFEFSDAEKFTVSFVKYDPSFAPRMKNRHRNSLHFADSLLGKIVRKLEELELDDDTILIISGDHGEAFFENGIVNHAGELYDSTLRVPMIFWGVPDNFKHTPITGTVSHLDIPPTALSLLQLPPYDGHQGNILFSKDLSNSRVFPSYLTIQSFAHQDGVVLWPFKLILDKRSLASELYNIETDPKELNNLWTEVETQSAFLPGQCLADVLENFRNRQLTFYQTEPNRRCCNFPPAEQRISEIGSKACNTLLSKGFFKEYESLGTISTQ